MDHVTQGPELIRGATNAQAISISIPPQPTSFPLALALYSFFFFFPILYLVLGVLEFALPNPLENRPPRPLARALSDPSPHSYLPLYPPPQFDSRDFARALFPSLLHRPPPRVITWREGEYTLGNNSDPG
ncbi:hypothetical protein N7505_008370 [Penicillium chrysogenum]|uniref:Uncharacterized protein n=1 Tax=Penicillium chrysogenum TaxID=5076 RepID=A0ABQ8W9L6_PENCH|nr:hypothetical protein N7505_008370 [Penicillium chrysogenum]